MISICLEYGHILLDMVEAHSYFIIESNTSMIAHLFWDLKHTVH